MDFKESVLLHAEYKKLLSSLDEHWRVSDEVSRDIAKMCKGYFELGFEAAYKVCSQNIDELKYLVDSDKQS